MENANFKRKLIDIGIILFAYLFCASIPFGLFIKGDNAEVIILLLQIIMQIIFLAFWIFFIPRSTLKVVKIRTNLKNYVLMIPVFLVCGSNFIYAAFRSGDFQPHFSWLFSIQVVLTFITVANEEYLFRLVLIGNLDPIKKPLLKIIVAAAVFAICHIGSFLNSFNPIDLINVAYTFGIGLVLGLIYVYGGAPCTCICLHLLFNLVNGLVFSYAFVVSDFTTYILVNCGLALVFGIYLLIIYLVRFRKCIVYNVRGDEL